MRRTKDEIKSINEIIEVLKVSEVLRLGINDTPYPYVVPVSFGFEENSEDILFYIHGANVGKKVSLLEIDNHICVEADICHETIDLGSSVTQKYESIIGYGKSFIVKDEQEKQHGMQLILEHYGYTNYPFTIKQIPILAIYKIIVSKSKITGKRHGFKR